MIYTILQRGAQNWFQIVVIVILVLCYIRLGKIEENAFYTADVVDDSSRRINSTLTKYLLNIESNTENTWQILDNRF